MEPVLLSPCPFIILFLLCLPLVEDGKQQQQQQQSRKEERLGSVGNGISDETKIQTQRGKTQKKVTIRQEEEGEMIDDKTKTMMKRVRDKADGGRAYQSG